MKNKKHRPITNLFSKELKILKDKEDKAFKKKSIKNKKKVLSKKKSSVKKKCYKLDNPNAESKIYNLIKKHKNKKKYSLEISKNYSHLKSEGYTCIKFSSALIKDNSKGWTVIKL